MISLPVEAPAEPFDAAAVDAVLSEIEAIDPGRIGSEERRAGMRHFVIMQGRIDAIKARWLAADAEGDKGLDKRVGMGRTTSWAQKHLHLGSSAAYAQVRTAQKLQELTATNTALARGDISSHQAGVICRALEEYRALGLDGEQEDAVESMLLQCAMDMEPKSLLQRWYDIRYRIRQEAGLAAEKSEREQRWLRLIEKPNGSFFLEGQLDAENGNVLRSALRSEMKKCGKDDDRSAEQRRADALVTLARKPMDAGSLPDHGGQRPHLMVSTDIETLRREPGSPLAKLAGGVGITGESARRIACDASLTVVVKDRRGDILHVGSESRTASPRMRGYVIARYKTCQAPGGCEVPAEECQMHHVEHWADCKQTTARKLIPLCEFHHHRAHPENQRFYRPPP